jgi:hypothetical protein
MVWNWRVKPVGWDCSQRPLLGPKGDFLGPKGDFATVIIIDISRESSILRRIRKSFQWLIPLRTVERRQMLIFACEPEVSAVVSEHSESITRPPASGVRASMKNLPPPDRSKFYSKTC